ncbi:MAG: diaminopimelate epimerase [Saprospiraceae bacterium]
MIPFKKYQGTGNDFVMIDQRQDKYLSRENTDKIQQLCDRHFGIGADGLILLELKEGYDFEMVYFNSDGRESSMCGNGGRCITKFAHDLGLIQNEATFLAIDGPHDAKVNPDGTVELKMKDIDHFELNGSTVVLDTGSPHYVAFVEDIEAVNIIDDARAIRYNDRFKNEGINVNFVQPGDNGELTVATYERGVEWETLSCGTGVTAAAIAHILHQDRPNGHYEVPIKAKGGELLIKFDHKGKTIENVWLCGPAEMVFEGRV